MLNRDSSENGIKINRFNKQKKNKFARVAPFFSNQQKKKKLNVLHVFWSFLAVVSHDYTIVMEKLSYVLTKDFVSCVHVRFYFFAGRSLLGPGFLIFSPPL